MQKNFSKIREEERISEIRDIIKVGYLKIAFPIFALFVFFDWIFAPQFFKLFFIMRLMIIPTGLLTFFAIKRVRTSVGAQLVCVASLFIIVLITTVIIAKTRDQFSGQYCGLILVTMGASFFIPFNTLFWVLSVFATYTIYYLEYLWTPTTTLDIKMLKYNTFFIVSTIIISYFVSRFNELMREKELRSRLALENEIASRDEIIRIKTKDAVDLEMALKRNDILASVAAEVSHNIRSPVSALSLVANSLTEISSEHRSIIQKATSRIDEIASRLLEVGRKNKSNHLLKEVPISDILVVVQETIREKRLQVGDKIEIKSQIEYTDQFIDSYTVKILPTTLWSILSNIVNNSVEAIEQVGSVIVKTTFLGSRLRISIEDNGHGIPKDVLPQIGMEGFSIGKNQGNGLGLYLARREIQNWGGTLNIESEQRKGTVVTIEIPVHKHI